MPKVNPDAEPMPRRMLSIPDACKYAGCARQKFQQFVEPHVRTCVIGARVMIDLQSLDDFLEERLELGS